MAAPSSDAQQLVPVPKREEIQITLVDVNGAEPGPVVEEPVEDVLTAGPSVQE